MARNQIRPARARRRAGDPRFPKGALATVFIGWLDSLPPSPARRDPVGLAESTAGSYASSGVGCDVEVRDDAGGTRCGDKPCCGFSYTLSSGGLSVLVRVCSEHVGIAIDEQGWERVRVPLEAFSVWEVMTG